MPDPNDASVKALREFGENVSFPRKMSLRCQLWPYRDNQEKQAVLALPVHFCVVPFLPLHQYLQEDVWLGNA